MSQPPCTTAAPAAARPIRRGSDYDDLLRRVGDRDRDAYDRLYRATRTLVFSRVRAIVRDIGYAEETCHEVYLQVWRSAAAFDPARGNALTWLCALAHHQAVDRVRRERTAYGYENRWGASDYRRPADVVAEEIVRRHEEHAVRTGLTALTPRQRESVILAFYCGLTYRQVAARLGIGEPAAKARIRSGLAQLKSVLLSDAAPART
ncbi:sigma-70 family RNA polymerase sigma factor [Nocardia otitidiscaviarum]|uniref:sigma-70 family RNA polymerase sigma factor n=1 Tax=Nocardia otitidiscaviarum TaxID=1823 RepID=UPI0009DE338E|nr:sigma-70 family RNA polymerase sigma factor [Nocardia otitidiscaviarum]MBF6132185.1 sigma-70 family RNA polymerase sigma factor [Nocardia otitidiscaviarum]MBF6483315.1 sigma-70 family RNA polymerase sigma factor [Nocardia otitidiscaviarum]